MTKKSFLFLTGIIWMLLVLAASAQAFEFKGFGDVTFTKSTQTGNEQGEFALGQLDLYTTQSIDDRTDVFVELVVEANDAGEFVIDLERLQLGYLLTDNIKLRAGRFHNILGYWNTAYHHGAQLYTSVARPGFLEFEDDGGILPSHIVGLWLSGRYKAPSADLNYSIMFGNGSKVNNGVLDANNIDDDRGNKAVSFRFSAAPEAIKGLEVGVSGNVAVVSGYDATNVETMRVKQQILALDVTYFANHAEFLAEYYSIKDKDDLTGDQKYSNSAYYVQAGYSIGKFMPFARFEKVSIDKDVDPYFNTLGTTDSERTVAGVRYNMSLVSAIKAEARKIDVQGADEYEEYALQWAVSF